MAKKEWTDDERFDIAQTIYGLIGLDIDSKEEQAIYDAIHIISPEYAAAMDERDQELEDFYYTMRIYDELGLEMKDASENDKQEKEDE